MSYPACPQCTSEFTYHDGLQLVCPECGHEWQAEDADTEAEELLVKDANGAVLADGEPVLMPVMTASIAVSRISCTRPWSYTENSA